MTRRSSGGLKKTLVLHRFSIGPRRLIGFVGVALLAMGLLLFSNLQNLIGAEAPKGPPPPPKAVFEDGSPWRAVDLEEALKRASETVPLVKEVVKETPVERKRRLGDAFPKLTDLTIDYMVLKSPMIEAEENHYGYVRFMHKKHAVVVGDCTVCHHYRPKDPAAKETTRCSACHQKAFQAGMPERPGLKAAYHLQCVGCHMERDKGPVGCTECHAKNVPDHSTLVKLPPHPEPMDVTKECLRCHAKAGEDMLASTHWLLRGPSPYTEGHEKDVSLGKAAKTVNNFCIALPSNWPRCTSCHAGYGWKDANFDFTDRTRIDCLVCHDATGTYAKIPTGAGMPYKELDLRKIAQNVGRPTRKNCGDCHFSGGGGDAVKHGDMNSILYYPSRNCDVHMGGMDFQCVDCHKTRNHKISGRSTSVPVVEGSHSCETCHTAQPHGDASNVLNHHLNRHTEHVACVTCHSPIYAKCKATKVFWDWSKAGDKKRKPKKDKYGMPDYSWQKGEFIWKESAKPEYYWYNGKVRRYVLGDRFEPNGPVKLTEPVGDIQDPQAKIYAFKVMRGRQPADAQRNVIAVPHLFGEGGYWKTLDWKKSIENGMKAAGLAYSGTFKWVDTVMYWGLNHEITPKNRALSCVQCHESLRQEPYCGRCHQNTASIDFKALAYRGIDFQQLYYAGRDTLELLNVTDYIGFQSLGYKGDPIVYGGRFKQLPLGQGPSLPKNP
ncbi:tetrathionate reductase family octaheme c-type cytochrome [Desulfosoma caldarium]|uniref:Octaheme c-type cytochrome (Tetrathionate reductase family) n=1 Tax=Desulfosoma caldarium TaxID=610254 RepID=A0A3N1UI67_9BACT|nr:tetrathionate reductase family octaheme c-type cytochrome [Desulfosoma caldarium]ROQ89823.1 octaheme c-type cytochrome (tetrathionate reductase family) [Desulfosoma caldarium]